MMVKFRGQDYTPQFMSRFMKDPDRQTREDAWKATSAARLIHELRSAGYLTVVRGGARRNHYTVRLHQPLTHRLERGHSVAEVLQLLPALDADPATT